MGWPEIVKLAAGTITGFWRELPWGTSAALPFFYVMLVLDVCARNRLEISWFGFTFRFAGQPARAPLPPTPPPTALNQLPAPAAQPVAVANQQKLIAPPVAERQEADEPPPPAVVAAD